VSDELCGRRLVGVALLMFIVALVGAVAGAVLVGSGGGPAWQWLGAVAGLVGGMALSVGAGRWHGRARGVAA